STKLISGKFVRKRAATFSTYAFSLVYRSTIRHIRKWIIADTVILCGEPPRFNGRTCETQISIAFDSFLSGFSSVKGAVTEARNLLTGRSKACFTIAAEY